MPDTILTSRFPLSEICEVPDKIISVYSLEKHVWADSNADAARKARTPELMTVEEFQLDPVRPFLTDILRNIAAPWKRERKDNPIGQGYWIQAEFGSGKSHLLCCLSALALGRKEAWDIVKKKEEASGRGKRESLFRFWEEGIESKSSKDSKGILVVVKTLVGSGGGTIGQSDKGRPLAEYILEAVKEQLYAELGKNVSLYPAELLADRFIKEDIERYRKDLQKFLHDPLYFDDDEFEDANEFIRVIQQNMTPEYKRSCGNKLWRFYTEYLKVQPYIAAETEAILKHLTEVVLEEGYSGLLLVLDEVSLFMKNRDDDQRADDEKTLVVLSNRLAKVYNLPIWTVCAAQQALESKMGVKNIIADDRLKLVKLLEEDTDYYHIVLARVRKIIQPSYIGAYYLHYRRGFSWPNSIGEEEFRHFFPFHKPAVEVLRAITYELTTTRSAIHFMHQTLKHQIKENGKELIRLWELFDEAVRYEEDPSGVHAGLVAIQTKRESDYRAYENCKNHIDGLTKGVLKIQRDKGVKVIQTLFLYHIAKTRQQGVTSEEIANSVLIERDEHANPEENNQHYENIAENLKKELRQIVQSFDEDKISRYRFDPVVTGVDPRAEFSRAKDEAESNEKRQREAWQHLLDMDEWKVQTRQMTLDLSGGVRSVFRGVASARMSSVDFGASWNGRQIFGSAGMRDFVRLDAGKPFPAVESDATDLDFAVYISDSPAQEEKIVRLLEARKDPRVILWTPDELTTGERDRLIAFAAYRILVEAWQGKETEDAVAVINWVSSSLQAELGTILKIVESSYGRGRIDALNQTMMPFSMAGELSAILAPIVDRVLTGTYLSKDIVFDPPYEFRDEEGVKLLNGIVRTGSIPKNAKQDKDVSAALNFGYALKIMKPGPERKLDTSGNAYVQDIWEFIDEKLDEHDQGMKIETLYKNFMGIGGPKDYGLTRRMVQIFLLCLVWEGKVRIFMSAKSGLGETMLEHSNLSTTVFSARILESMLEVRKAARPENWDVLRPYAEKLLAHTIPENQTDTEIIACQDEIRKLFHDEKLFGIMTMDKAQNLFGEINKKNPYEKEMEQMKKLFSADIDQGNDIDRVLYALKTAFGYQAFDEAAADQTEVDDLAACMKHYRNMQGFMRYEVDIRTAYKYCGISVGGDPALSGMAAAITAVKDKLGNLNDYIDSEVRLRTELIGSANDAATSHGTIAAMIKEYTLMYSQMHDMVLSKADAARKSIQDMMDGDTAKALAALDTVKALRPAAFHEVAAKLIQLKEGIFACQSPSRSDVERVLKNDPVHGCKLMFDDAENQMKQAENAIADAADLLDEAFRKKLDVFRNDGVRELLEQGKDNKRIAELLDCETEEALKAFFVRALKSSPELPELINKYMRRIMIKKVRLADFKPDNTTIQKDQITGVTEEFRRFLEEQFTDGADDDDALPVLQLE